jgi:hypothetical protein
MENEPANLTIHRAAGSVWDRQDYERSRARSLSALGFFLIAAGAYLVGKGYRSQLAVPLSRVPEMLPRRSKALDEINKAAEESFPASDPPAWTTAVGKPAHTGVK